MPCKKRVGRDFLAKYTQKRIFKTMQDFFFYCQDTQGLINVQCAAIDFLCILTIFPQTLLISLFCSCKNHFLFVKLMKYILAMLFEFNHRKFQTRRQRLRGRTSINRLTPKCELAALLQFRSTCILPLYTFSPPRQMTSSVMLGTTLPGLRGCNPPWLRLSQSWDHKPLRRQSLSPWALLPTSLCLALSLAS